MISITIKLSFRSLELSLHYLVWPTCLRTYPKYFTFFLSPVQFEAFSFVGYIIIASLEKTFLFCNTCNYSYTCQSNWHSKVIEVWLNMKSRINNVDHKWRKQSSVIQCFVYSAANIECNVANIENRFHANPLTCALRRSSLWHFQFVSCFINCFDTLWWIFLLKYIKW